ncbi:hypothetical protein GO755_17475 [Spirosoma sp. HMF4905]|uniref:Uncharacterized protein n=1 Tax=Spirosoma arboris TaxID=2682092 RepID=A0A7K1SDI0_9BACT|nr:hypothetical protein [Spirosoma arboris]MVM31843.1 hypothetical protein [Spirosoma arboris]
MHVRLIALLIGGLALSQSGYSQTKGPSFFLRRYVADITLKSRGQFATGVLYEVTDSTLVLAPIKGIKPKLNALIVQRGGTLPPTDSVRRVIPLQTYRYSAISLITVHRRGRGARGLLFGTLIGVVTGFIHGGDPETIALSRLRATAGDYAIAYGLIFSVPGALVGGSISRRVDAKKQSIAVEVPRRFRKLSIVDQVNQANLYKP